MCVRVCFCVWVDGQLCVCYLLSSLFVFIHMKSFLYFFPQDRMAVIARSSRLILVQLEATRTQHTQGQSQGQGQGQSPSSIHAARALGRGAENREELEDDLDSALSPSLSAASDLPLGGFHLCQVRCVNILYS